MGATFTINSTSTYVYLNQPDTVRVQTTRDLYEFKLVNGDFDIQDAGKHTDQLIIRGVEVSSATTTMRDLHYIMEAGDMITVSGLNDSNLNAEYYIEQLQYTQPLGMMNRYDYMIILEKNG